MDRFLQLPPERRLLAFQQVDEVMGLQAASVEKDLWVSWTLRALFTMPGIGARLTFKGGTSLSKAWKLIERFSEDIDLVVDKSALGFGGNASPDKTSSNKQRRARLEKLMVACRNWVQGPLLTSLRNHMHQSLKTLAGNWRLIPSCRTDSACFSNIHPSFNPRRPVTLGRS